MEPAKGTQDVTGLELSGATAGGASRRGVLLGAGALGAGAVLTACGGATKTEQSAGSADHSTATTSVAGGAQVDASTVPVGGGVVLEDAKVVITQPQAGQFHAFTAVCTHKGCTVTRVADGVIECPCHGSTFSATDGSVEHGPASKPLAAKTVTRDGSKLTVS